MRVNDSKTGRNDPCPCGKLNQDGRPKKYKKCCEDDVKAGKKRLFSIGRRDFISGPFVPCPMCRNLKSFGVFISISGVNSYSRECVKCGHEQRFPLSKIKKQIVYLDQFVISNLIKLLDKDHKSHNKLKSDPFWAKLFIKLEAASKSQAIVCPDSYFHREESLVSSIDFGLMKRLHKHFSSGKTLHPSHEIERMQIYEHFQNWLKGQKTVFSFSRDKVSDEDLDTWSVGLQVTVNMRPFPGEVDNLKNVNSLTEEQLKNIWTRWQSEKDFAFMSRIKEETLSFGKSLIIEAQKFQLRRRAAIARMSSGESGDFDLDDLNDITPPATNGILDSLFLAAQIQNISEDQIPGLIVRYFNDANALLEIPKIRISSVMFAGLARRAQLGKKKPPKSLVDVNFISSYLPYCDALFVDIESRSLLKELPRETPEDLRLKNFPARVFSLNQREDFLDYLDEVVANIPPEQITALKDLNGDNYAEPYWEIIENEKREMG
jgi:Zn ribbon nucleic-acid-binding protein